MRVETVANGYLSSPPAGQSGAGFPTLSASTGQLDSSPPVDRLSFSREAQAASRYGLAQPSSVNDAITAEPPRIGTLSQVSEVSDGEFLRILARVLKTSMGQDDPLPAPVRSLPQAVPRTVAERYAATAAAPVTPLALAA